MPTAPSSPQIPRTTPKKNVSPLAVLGAALAAGYAAAKLIDWRGHAHPHR
jgi:hypothetical protein